jgi:hypothetical protein
MAHFRGAGTMAEPIVVALDEGHKSRWSWVVIWERLAGRPCCDFQFATLRKVSGPRRNGKCSVGKLAGVEMDADRGGRADVAGVQSGAAQSPARAPGG